MIHFLLVAQHQHLLPSQVSRTLLDAIESSSIEYRALLKLFKYIDNPKLEAPPREKATILKERIRYWNLLQHFKDVPECKVDPRNYRMYPSDPSSENSHYICHDVFTRMTSTGFDRFGQEKTYQLYQPSASLPSRLAHGDVQLLARDQELHAPANKMLLCIDPGQDLAVMARRARLFISISTY